MKRVQSYRTARLFAALFAIWAMAAPHHAWAQASVGTTKTPASTPAALVDINTATESELEDVPGIGPAYAKKIIAGRPYATVDDLSKTGIPANRLNKITPMVTVKTKSSTKASTKPAVSTRTSTAGSTTKTTETTSTLVDINTATEADLEQVTGVGPAYAKKIIAHRPYASVKELSKTGIPANRLAKITPLVTVKTAVAGDTTKTTTTTRCV